MFSRGRAYHPLNGLTRQEWMEIHSNPERRRRMLLPPLELMEDNNTNTIGEFYQSLYNKLINMGKAPRKQLAYRSKPLPVSRAINNNNRRGASQLDRTVSVNTRVRQLLQQMRAEFNRFSASLSDLFEQMASAMDASPSSSAQSTSSSHSVVTIEDDEADVSHEADGNSNDGH